MNLEDKKLELLEIAKSWYSGEEVPDLAISDLDFDSKEKEILLEDPSWDYRVVLDNQGDSQIHYYPMPKIHKRQETELSMDEVYNIFLNKKDVESLPKYDGGGVALYYNEGVFYDAVTRSSTVSGKRQYAKLSKMVPKYLEDKDIVAIECEAICTFDKGHGDLSRQAATGLLNSNSLQERCEDELTIVAIKVRFKDGVKKDWTVSMKELPTKEVRNNITFIASPISKGKYNANKFTCDQFQCLIDGVVEYNKVTEEYMAHKLYFNEKKLAVIKKIHWGYTPTSMKFVPKYEFDTVKVDGTNVSCATGGGTAQLKKMKCGVGSEVEVIKAGLTIPQVLRPTSNSVNYEYNLEQSRGMHSFDANHYEMVIEMEKLRSQLLSQDDSEKEHSLSEYPEEISLTKKEEKNLSEAEITDLKINKLVDDLKSRLTLQSSFNTSEDYSLPLKCDCGNNLDWKDELNGGLYCTNANCSLNLETLENQLKSEEFYPNDLVALISRDPERFLTTYFKIPRFAGAGKLKKGKVMNDFICELMIVANPAKLVEEYFNLSGLQIDVIEKLNGVVHTFITDNI